ncbi:16S rRNA (uracil(1498)-N(3))-methyltransferase, partial [Methylophilaceae bacterium]|nr:16S rRNA (uracil(1498)-N(3))-methyltransferase [Methylophilaceae bacterium]
MKRFYHPDTLEINQNIYLDDLAAHHALQVMRVQVKDQFIVFNGDGFNYKVEVIGVEKKKLKINIISKDENHSESQTKITLIQSLSTNEKMDWIIQKATELGVNKIVPIYSTRSIIKLDSTRADKKLIHWQQVLISACEQSGRSRIPQIYKPTNFIKALENPELNEKTLKLILAPNGQ